MSAMRLWPLARRREPSTIIAPPGEPAAPAWTATHLVRTYAAQPPTCDTLGTDEPLAAVPRPRRPVAEDALAELAGDDPATRESAAGLEDGQPSAVDDPDDPATALRAAGTVAGRHRHGCAATPVAELLHRDRVPGQPAVSWAAGLGAPRDGRRVPRDQVETDTGGGWREVELPRYRPLEPANHSQRAEPPQAADVAGFRGPSGTVTAPAVAAWASSRGRGRRRERLASTVLVAAMLLAGVIIACEVLGAGGMWNSSSLRDALPAPETSPYGATGALPGSLVTTLPGATPGAASSDAGLPPAAGLVGIPATLLAAYHDAETHLAATSPGCRLSWSLVAGIGKIESDHARGGQVDTAGTTITPILGPVLDGSGANAAITDTDGGRLDRDSRWDRAVGPTQFLPGTWTTWGTDANGDGVADPNNAFDAATATGRYLCAGGTDTSTPAGVHDAVFRYNHSESYVAHVLAWAHAYATGTLPITDLPAAVPDDLAPATPPDTAAVLAPPAQLAAPAPLPAGSPVGTGGGGAATAAPAAGSDLIPITGPATGTPPTAPAIPTAPAAPAPTSTVSSRATTTTTQPVTPPSPSTTTTTAPTTTTLPTSTTAPTTTTEPTSTTAPTTTTTSTRPSRGKPLRGSARADGSTSSPRAGDAVGATGSTGSSSDSAAGDGGGVPVSSGSDGGGSTLDTTRSGVRALLGDVQTEGGPRPTLVSTAQGPGLRFSLPGGGRRSEVIPPLTQYREGQQMWLHYRAELAGVPVDTNTWQLIVQFHHDGNTGSPPIALEVGHGRLRLANQGTHQQDLGPVAGDGTVDVVLHVVFSRDPSRGQVDVTRDGTPVLVGYHPPGGTLLDGGDYLKLGLYRDPSISQPSSVTITEVQAGPTAAAVDASSR